MTLDFDPREVIQAKRDGLALTDAAIERFIAAYAAGDVPDYQAAALTACVFVRGLSPDELTAWTRAMLDSGGRLEIPGLDRPRVDKHSTGGVGDKASIPLAPALAAAGLAVPMVSGRGLGHTGGTLDKLEAIPGLRTSLSADDIAQQVRALGFCFAGQTPEIAPADGKLYALRDATGLVESIPLIASSIMSKKLAENLDALVLDVKFGSGAFLGELEAGRELAQAMVGLAQPFGVRCCALQTYMGRPLGRAVGHSLEIAESVRCLQGSGPRDLRELVTRLGAELLLLVGEETELSNAVQRIARHLDDGSALSVFRTGVEAQGGDPRCIDATAGLPDAPDVSVIAAESSGHLAFRDLREVGHAVALLGGGRLALGDEIDPGVGLVFLAEEGEALERDQPVVEVHHRGGRGLEVAHAALRRGLHLTPEPSGRAPLVGTRIS